MNSLKFYKKLGVLAFSLIGCVAFSQPANDDCDTAQMIMVAEDEASVVLIEGNTIGATMSSVPEDVCSGSWFADDIWYVFEIGEIPEFGINLFASFGDMESDVIGVGMALYESCDTAAIALACFSSGDDSQVGLEVPGSCLIANSTYHLRVWSGGSPTDNSGTFRLGAFNRPELNPDYMAPEGFVLFEDFNEGFGDWTTESLNNIDSLWQFYPDGTVPDGFGGFTSFAGVDAQCSGVVGFPALHYNLELPGMFLGEFYVSALVSPSFDASELCNTLKVDMDMLYRKGNSADPTDFNSIFTGNPGRPNIFIQYSKDDGATWSGYVEIRDDVGFGNVVNQKESVLLPGGGGSDSTKIRFVWNSDFYYLAVDNIFIYDAPLHDQQVQNNFFSIAPNYQVPKSQTYPFGFLTDIRNVGCSDEPNTTIRMTITDEEENELFVSDLTGITTTAGFTFENMTLPDLFTPPDIPGTYTGTYSVISESMDEDASNDAISFDFLVSEDTYANENGTTFIGSFTQAAWGDQNTSFGFGNYFKVPNGNGYAVKTISFDLVGDPAKAGEIFQINLYSWVDENLNTTSEVEERELLGFFDYEMTGDELLGELQEVVLEANSGEDKVLLGDSMQVIVMVERKDNDMVDEMSELGFDDTFGQLATMEFASAILDTIHDGFDPLYWSFSYTTDADDPVWISRGANERVPVVRMTIEKIVSDVDDPLADENILEVYPNPSRDQINLNIQLTENETQARVNIIDITGKVVRSFEYVNVQNDAFTYEIGDFADGVYLLQYVSETGSRTLKFMKQ